MLVLLLLLTIDTIEPLMKRYTEVRIFILFCKKQSCFLSLHFRVRKDPLNCPPAFKDANKRGRTSDMTL